MLPRYAVMAKSPHSSFRKSEAGILGPEPKKAGYDGIIVAGRAPKMVYLWLPMMK